MNPTTKRNLIALKAFILAGLLLCFSACRNMAPDNGEPLSGYVPDTLSRDDGMDAGAHQIRWWKEFNSSQLNRLMEQAFQDSLTLEQAAARVEQFEAIARRSGAATWPSLTARAEGSTRDSGAAGSAWSESYSGGLYASYEADLWGEINMNRKAALADLEGRRFDMQTAAMSLASNLAQTYFTWLARTEILSIYESQLDSNRKKLESLELRYRTGQATSLAVLQQRQQVAGAEARIPPVMADIETLEHRIAVLIGAIPGADLGLAVEPLPELPVRPSTGLPVEILQNRPDVQSARLALEAANLDVGVARAARLPSITLSASVSSDSDELSSLFDDWAKRLAANLVGPIIDGGQRKADLDRAFAVARERVAGYRLTVLEAIQEVEDALVNETYQGDYVAALGRQYLASKDNEAESIRRYRRGIVTFLDTLNATTGRESLEISLVQARAILLQDRVQLYRALGGDWKFLSVE